MTETPPARPRLLPNAVLRDEGDGALVYLPEADRVLEVNATGQAILRLMDGDRTVDVIAERLVKQFETTFERARTDVATYVERLAQQGLLHDG